MSYIDKKYFKEGANENLNNIDLYKNKTTGDLVYRNHNGIEVVVAPPNGVLNLVGPQGPQGIQGPVGPQGALGPVGPAGLTWQGAWSALSTYAIDDAVGYNGASWFCINPVGPSVTTPDLDPTNWALLAAQGAQGPVGATGAQGPTGPQGPSGSAGVHALIKPVPGMLITPSIGGNSTYNNVNYPGASVLVAYPFIPKYTFTVSELQVEVTTASAFQNIRVLVYSHSEATARPDQKMFESANIPTDTTGIKTIPCAQEFVAGVTYWFASHSSSIGVGMKSLEPTHMINFGVDPVLGTMYNLIFKYGVPIGSAPQTWGTTSASSNGRAWRVVMKA
jgi:hypothetical protein